MKLGFLVVAAGIVVFIWRSLRNPSMPGWDDDLDAALVQARDENRKIVVFFMNRPPGDSDRWNRDSIIRKQGNQQALRNGNFIRVTIQLPRDWQSEAAKRYKLKDLPTLLLLDPDGKELNRREGRLGELDFRSGFLDCAKVVWNPPMPGWDEDLDAALVQARAEKRRIVVFFMNRPPGEWDRWNRDSIIRKAGNQQALKKGNFIRVTIQLPRDWQSEAAKRYKLKDLPTLLLLDPDGKELNRREGRLGELDFRNGFLDCAKVLRD